MFIVFEGFSQLASSLTLGLEAIASRLVGWLVGWKPARRHRLGGVLCALVAWRPQEPHVAPRLAPLRRGGAVDAFVFELLGAGHVDVLALLAGERGERDEAANTVVSGRKQVRM